MTDDLRELARLLPDPARHELPGPRHDALRELLMQEITDDRTTEPERSGREAGPAVPPARPRRRRILLPAIAGGLVMVLAALWLTSAFVFGVGRFWSGRTPAGELLGRIALAAYSSDDLPPMDQIRDDQFIYIESYGAFGTWTSSEFAPDEPHQRQIWLSVDGSQTGLLRDPRVDSTDISLNPLPGGYLNAPTFRYLTTLPTDPDLLLLKIYRETWGHGPNPQQEAFVTIGDLIRESIVPPDLAVALYQAAARIPGVAVVDDSVDALGRHGIAVARASGGVRNEWIFDRDTLQFLGEREVLTGEPIGMPVPAGGQPHDWVPEAGTVVGSMAVVTRAVVDHAGEVPA